MRQLFASAAMLPRGWAENVLFEVAPSGVIETVTPGFDPYRAAPPVQRLRGPVLPGMPNLHSNAILRGLAGLTEGLDDAGDGPYRSWRHATHRFAARLGPEALEAIATQLYVEMLKAGYTSVGEFHMLHHQPDGTAYEDLAETSHRVIAAARRAGIGLTLLPVLYRQADFKGAPLSLVETRFSNDVERYLRLVGLAHEICADDPTTRVGIAPYSLRAVPPDDLAAAVLHMTQEDPNAPVHLRAAGQRREVEDCMAWSGKRPVRWLLDNTAVGPRWCVIHATHMDEGEVKGLVERGAVAGLCPTTEANLGGGLFPALPFLRAGGLWGIGSASQVTVDPAQELRLLEYGQRLAKRARAILVPEVAETSVGAALYRMALTGGAQALSQPVGALAPGKRADLIVLDGNHPVLFDKVGDSVVDALVFAAGGRPVQDVMVNGEWLVEAGRHVEEDRIWRKFRETMWHLVAEEG